MISVNIEVPIIFLGIMSFATANFNFFLTIDFTGDDVPDGGANEDGVKCFAAPQGNIGENMFAWTHLLSVLHLLYFILI